MPRDNYGPPIPTVDLVTSAAAEFDEAYKIIEQALKDLFTQYPRNDNHPHVLLKVMALNALYSTQIPIYSTTVPNVGDMAQHICEHSAEVDSALKDGLPKIVDTIRLVTVSGKKDRNYFSFATKYCSWHNWDAYPIWDSQVENYLGCLKNGYPVEWAKFGGDFDINGHWNYPAFHQLMIRFRECYSLRSISFKDIDKFLWQYGDRSFRMAATQG